MTRTHIEPDGAAILDMRGVRLAFGVREVLRGVDLQLARGTFTALMGLSGVGKTSILRAIVALDPFTAGTIEVDGVQLQAGPLPRESRLRALRRKVGMVFQLHHLFEHLSATDNVTLALVHALGVPRAQAEARAAELLDALQVSGRARALPRELSGGEAQRVAIARALATDPPLLLLDEPTASLDPARREELGRSLTTLASTGRTLMVTTHDVEFARQFAQRVVIVADGQIVETGHPREVLSQPSHAATRALLQGALRH
ncbi:MAG TPA: ATP-binding cassette domain-containing protein [Vicinamibacterales bacterium]|jgi:ABC-type polar amino acid transport system ATPase subunit